MHAAIFMIGLSLVAAQRADTEDEALVEGSMREELSRQGQVVRLEMIQRSADYLDGYAVVRDAEGVDGRVDCTARRTGADSFNWDCLPVITEPVIRDMERLIRSELSRQVTVLALDLERENDQRMIGSARLRTAEGAVVTARCTADREDPRSRTFNWECLPEQ